LEEKEGKEALGTRLLVYDVGGLGRTLEAERRIGGQAMKTSFAGYRTLLIECPIVKTPPSLFKLV
jgi:hypothetical protein